MEEVGRTVSHHPCYPTHKVHTETHHMESGPTSPQSLAARPPQWTLAQAPGCPSSRPAQCWSPQPLWNTHKRPGAKAVSTAPGAEKTADQEQYTRKAVIQKWRKDKQFLDEQKQKESSTIRLALQEMLWVRGSSSGWNKRRLTTWKYMKV
jgi:hypothetical protein